MSPNVVGDYIVTNTEQQRAVEHISSSNVVGAALYEGFVPNLALPVPLNQSIEHHTVKKERLTRVSRPQKEDVQKGLRVELGQFRSTHVSVV